ncbi:MAG TPA: transketolase [Mycobacteriales bacterium]|nr:transketolase [Mycobacteriales bacterium]
MRETMREAFARTATDLVRTDPDAVVVLAVISRELFPVGDRVVDGRIVDVGIAEQCLIGVAAGMAMTGLRPIVHSIAPFLVERPYEQIKADLVLQRLPAVLVSTGASYDYASDGGTHSGHGDVAVLHALPGVGIRVPGTAAELEAVLRETYRRDEVTYLRMSTADNGEPHADASVLRHGGRATVVAVGPMLAPVLAATEGLDVTVLYTSTVRPFAGAALAAVAGEGPVVTVEPYAGEVLLGAVLDALAPRPVRVVPIGVPRAVAGHYGTPADHDRTHRLDPASLRDRIAAVLA